ncbi:MAG: hypothetical protein IT435_09605 [Phycisphaerales bacterium]|nr:hypothetical protein [Phycisphaerales bacterium]
MTRKNIAVSLTTLLVIAAGAATAAARPLVNGSFETGTVYLNGLDYNDPGTPAPWYATVYTPDLYDNTSANGWGLGGLPNFDYMFEGMLASDGNRFIGFAASSTYWFSEAFAQQTAPLTPGQQYTLTASIAADDLGKAIPAGGPYYGRGEVDVYLDGGLIGTLTQNTASLTWETRSFTFIAPAWSSANFEFVSRVDPNLAEGLSSSYIGLDDIQLAPVPTPGAVALLGLAGLAAMRRRVR